MVTPLERKRYTLSEYETFIENMDVDFEFIGGEIVEVPSNPYSSKIASRINFFISQFVYDNDLGHVTGEAGLYQVAGERYAPDVAFISYEKQAELPYHQGFNPSPPNLAVEVVSPSDKERHLSIKIANYLYEKTVVWVVQPETQEVEVYIPDQPVQIVGKDEVIEGGDVLPGFELKVGDIFR